LKVLHLIAPVRFGGGESLLANLVRHRRDGLSEAVAMIYAAPAFEAAVRASAIPVTCLSARSLGDGVARASLLADLWRWPAMLSRLARLTFRWRPDLVHAHGFPAIALWRLLRALGGPPGFYTHHFHRAAAGRGERLVLGALYRGCAVRTGVSDVVSNSMMQAFPRAGPFHTVPNAVGEDFFAGAPDPEFLAQRPAGRALFIHPARFSPFKNQRLVVEALAALAPSVRDRLAVWFAGEGPERPAIEAEVARLGLGGAVRFLGAVPYARMPGLMAAADFGLFPSELEGFGLGAAECMAAGRPVLALDNALMREVVGIGGLLVPRDRLAEGLAEMLDHGPALADAARASAARFRIAACKDAYLALYARALERAG
jgi:glycosyltransferase involved in cell wall biosynthesis